MDLKLGGSEAYKDSKQEVWKIIFVEDAIVGYGDECERERSLDIPLDSLALSGLIELRTGRFLESTSSGF